MSEGKNCSFCYFQASDLKHYPQEYKPGDVMYEPEMYLCEICRATYFSTCCQYRREPSNKDLGEVLAYGINLILKELRAK